MKNYELVLESGRSEAHYWRDLWRYRELLYTLAWRDILVRYKQTVVGILWALIRPFITMVVFTVIFHKLAKLPAEGAPYPILVFAALLPWQLFSNTMSDCGSSVLSNAGLVSKVYFPRLLVPASTLAVGLVDFAISFGCLLILMLYYLYVPTIKILILPALVVLALVAAGGAGLWLTALTVKFRDFRFITPFLIQFGLYLSPVGFSSSLVPEEWRPLYCLNPMVGIIDAFRWAIVSDGTPFNVFSLSMSAVTSLLLLASGIWYFRKTERGFVDIL